MVTASNRRSEGISSTRLRPDLCLEPKRPDDLAKKRHLAAPATRRRSRGLPAAASGSAAPEIPGRCRSPAVLSPALSRPARCPAVKKLSPKWRSTISSGRRIAVRLTRAFHRMRRSRYSETCLINESERLDRREGRHVRFEQSRISSFESAGIYLPARPALRSASSTKRRKQCSRGCTDFGAALGVPLDGHEEPGILAGRSRLRWPR